MKRIFFLASLWLIAVPAHAQTNTFPSSGSVGIGTTSPQAQLDVVTTSTPATRGIASYQYGNTGLAALLTLYKAGGTPSSPTAVTSSGYGSGINMDAYDGTNFLDTAGYSSRINGTITTGSVPQDLILYTTGGANDGDPYANGHVRMVITAGGNVGIGTLSPQSLLSVAGNGEFGSGDNGTPAAATIRGANAAGTNISGGSLTIQGGLATGNAATGDILFQGAPLGSSGTTQQTATTYLAIKGGGSSAGSIGIGTTATVAGGGLTIAPVASTSGTPSLLTITGPADTTLAASTEANDVFFNLNRTVQFATGALTTQRAVYIKPPTYSFVGASTITNAATVDISGAPVAGTNATITNTASLIVESGNVGIGTTAPANPLSVNGTVQSLTGGFKFPDGTTQTTAATPPASPGIVLLATVNASGASSVSFGSSYITSAYNKYVVEFDSVYGSSNGADLYLTISTNNGSSYLSANYLFGGTVTPIAANSPSVGGFSGGTFGTSQFKLTDGTNAASLSSSSTVPSQGRLALSSPSAAKQLNITWDMVAAGNSSPSAITGGGYNTGTTAINAIQFTASSGTLTGNFHLYGLSGT